MKRVLLYSTVALLLVAGEPAVAAIADLLPDDGGPSALATVVGWFTSGANAAMTLPVLPGR